MVNHLKQAKILDYNENIDRPEGGFTRQEKIKWQDELHCRLFPEKYNEEGIRIHE